MHLKPPLLPLACFAACAIAHGQPVNNGPRIGYLYPAGAATGTTVEILAGGQRLQAMNDVRISGDGVRASIIKTYRPTRNLDGDQRKLLQWRVASCRAELNGGKPPPRPNPPAPLPDGKPAPPVELPDSPLLDLLGSMNLAQIQHAMTTLQRRDRTQQNPQLGEMVRIRISIAADAPPGMRQLRFSGPQGLSNPINFEVGSLTEFHEAEPNESSPPGPAAETPCTFNGQILPGDVDIHRFRAKRGQNLLVRGMARSLIPYLADAVPGWFQMVVTLRDTAGRELAYADDFRFDPDPALCFKVPADGEYLLEIRDSIYRGREDFVYRVDVGQLPFITSIFPLGGRQGEPLAVSARGWNLPGDRIRLDTAPGDPIRTARKASNEVSYAISPLPEHADAEPNDDSDHATKVAFPCVINGRIDNPGDADVFRIDARAGRELVVEVLARRLKSPLDSVVHVADENGNVLGWNDDSMETDGTLHLGDGLLTHYADSRVRVTPKADGPVFIRIADTQLHGGPEYAYRLTLDEPRPDFELRVTPSALNIQPGDHVPVRVHALRNNGFEGEIRLALKNAPSGFRLNGARIPAGASQIRMTLTTDPQGKGGIFTPELTGTAGQPGETVTRTAIAADDLMQACLWRHLMPASEWLVSVPPSRGRRVYPDLENPGPLTLPAGGSAVVRVTMPKWMADRGVELEPSELPPGIRLSPPRPTPTGIAFDVVSESAAQPGLSTNLIVALFASDAPPAKPGAKASQRYLISGLPAIPVSITPPASP